MRFAASSDWHLDASTAGVDRYPDLAQAVDHTVDHAVNAMVNTYVFGGDLCDPHTVRAHRAVTKALEVQHRLHRERITPIFVAGNHDVIEDGSGYTTLSPLRASGIGYVFERPQAVVLGDRPWSKTNLIVLPYTATSHAYDPDEFVRSVDFAEPELPTLVVGHLNLKGITAGSETTDMPRGRDLYWPLEALAECFPNAMLLGGHYHAPQEYKGVQIIGSLGRLRFGDEARSTPNTMVMEV